MRKKPSSSGFMGFTGFLDDILARMRCRKADDLIPRNLRAGGVLDIGCGAFPIFLSRTEFSEKVGLDRIIHGECASEYASKGIRLECHDIQSSEGKLPFGSEAFDAVVMLAFIEHLQEPELKSLLREVNRILRPGGVCVLTTPAPRAMSLLWMMAWAGLLTPESIEEHKKCYSPPMVKGVLLEAGFEEDGISTGHFELFMNVWARASKRLTKTGSIG